MAQNTTLKLFVSVVVFLGLTVSVTSGLKCYHCRYTEIDGSDVSNQIGCGGDDPINSKYLQECVRRNPPSWAPDAEVNIYCTTWMNKRWHLNGTLWIYGVSRGCTTSVGTPQEIGCKQGGTWDPLEIGIVSSETCLCDTEGCNNIPRP